MNRLWLQWAAISGIIAPILFTLLVIITTLATPGYNMFSQTISELGQVGQTYALVQDANFVLTGLLIIIFTIGLRSSIAPSGVSGLGPVLIFAYPAAFVFVGTVIPLPSPFHIPVGSIGYFVTLLGMILTSRPMRRDAPWNRLALLTLLVGIILVIGFFVYGFLQSQGFLTDWLGLVQRLELAPFFLWTEVMGIRLYSASRELPIKATS